MDDYSEDWCFICKDGGVLLLCDHEGCSKVYHPKCVGKKKTSLKSKKSWTCSKHTCSVCPNGPTAAAISFSCLCCPYALCNPCYTTCTTTTTTTTTTSAAEFSLVRGKDKSGLCNNCLELVRFAEANSEYGADGEKLDFEDRDTFECRFKESWEIIKENEGLTLDDVYSPNDIEFHNSILGKRKKQEDAECIGMGIKTSASVPSLVMNS